MADLSVKAKRPLRLCSRGSALALAQAHQILAACRKEWPGRTFDLRIIKTTGDKLTTASLANPNGAQPMGLFTKELEAALLAGEADIAVHSLKDLPTDLPEGLVLAAVPKRADVREVLIFRDADSLEEPTGEWSPGTRLKRGFAAGTNLGDLPGGTILATSSTRRMAHVRHVRPDVEIVPIRGNVGTRLQKVAENPQIDATLLAAAGLNRLNFVIRPDGALVVHPRLASAERDTLDSRPPPHLLAVILEPDEMLPAIGQGALGLETRADDVEAIEVCAGLNHMNSFQAVTAERELLSALGGGCQSPVAAYARIVGHQLYLRAISFRDATVRTAEGRRKGSDARQLGRDVAARLHPAPAHSPAPT